MQDLQVCLESHKVTLPADSRNIAVTHSQIGVPHDEAFISLEDADAALRNTLVKLEGMSGKMAKMEVTESNPSRASRN